MSNLPTLNQYLGPGGNQFPKTVPGFSTVPEQNPPQQHQHPGNWNQPHGQHHHHGHGPWNQPPQGNWNQPPQGNWNQPPQGNWNQNPGYAQQQPQQGNWNQNQGYYNNFKNEIYNLRNQYGMQIPENEIDQTLDAAKANKRMYAFTEPEKNYIRYDEKGKSYIAVAHTYGWAHKSNNQYFDEKKLPNSYDGTSSHLIKVCFLDVRVDLKHVKPGNYKLFVNEAYENAQIRGQFKVKVTVGDKEVYNNEALPNADMIKDKDLTEHFICDIKRQDFDMNRLDQNGDAIVKVAIAGKDNSWKKGWTFDGLRLLETN
jgi:hypothetical protein